MDWNKKFRVFNIVVFQKLWKVKENIKEARMTRVIKKHLSTLTIG